MSARLEIAPGVALEIAERALEPLLDALAARLGGRTPAEEPAAQEWLTCQEAADYIRAPRSRVYELVARKEIPHEKDGARLLFNRRELSDWIRRGGGKRAGR